MDSRLGQRRSFDGNLCTIRYVGEVAGTTGEWLGVEWDDATRGKHSGEHKGVRYFTCTYPLSDTECQLAKQVRQKQPVHGRVVCASFSTGLQASGIPRGAAGEVCVWV